MSVFAVSDIHGNLEIAQQVVRKAIEGNTIYFLGDACDRGKHGWQIIKMFLTTPNIVYLMGNHEDMLIRAMRPYFMGDDKYRFTHSFEVWSWNGSALTEFDIINDNFETAHMFFSQLHTLKMIDDYTNEFGQVIHMCHSGYEFWDDEFWEAQEVLWDRNHYMINKWWYDENEFVVHGHTSIPHVIEDIGDPPYSPDDSWFPSWDGNSAFWYCENHKVDIDMRTAMTGKACLLNLDTFEEIILEGDE